MSAYTKRIPWPECVFLFLLVVISSVVVILCSASAVDARELNKKIPMLGEPVTEGAVGGAFGVSQVPTDTFYYGGTVWDAIDGQWEAAEPTTPGWTDRKMWTWSPGGFGGTPHSGLNMDGWVGVDATADVADNFNVEDSTTIGACASSKVLFCGLTNAECVDACYADLNGTGYGNGWNQMVATPGHPYTGTEQIQLAYDYFNETEAGYDYTYVKLQVYDSVGLSWVDFQTLATYEGSLSGSDNHDIDSYLSGSGYTQWRIVFQFQSDGGWSDEDDWYPTSCGACWFDNYSITGDLTDSESFESVTLGGLPGGWSKYVSGCGNYVATEHISNLNVPVTLDPCVTAVPGWCSLEDSVLVFIDSGDPVYPHPLCQDNYAVSPVIDFSNHPGLPGRILCRERFGNLMLHDHVFMYWQVRYKPGCDAGGWSRWVTDYYVYYTREGPSCATWVTDVSSYIPPTAEKAQAALGVINLCLQDTWGVGCSYVCNVTPYFDNVTFGVYGSDVAPYISMRELDYWQDQFAENGSLSPSATADTRSPNYLSDLVPPIFGDTLVCRGSADNMEVYFVFRMAKVGPWQETTHDFFTTWFPGVTGGGWYEARMDTSEVTETSGVSTAPAPGWWMCAFHEDDPVRVGNALSECTEILPNNLFVPGARIEYFLKARYAGSSDFFFLPDTTGGAYEEFEVLPMMRYEGGVEWPCLIVVDHFGRRGNGGETNSDRIARHLTALGYDFDVYNRLGPASDLRNGIGRWPPNTGQIGGFGTDKYNWGPGATISQLNAYKYCILNAGDIYGYSIYQQDTELLTNWLSYFSPFIDKFLWVSGDQIWREMNRRTPWGPQFMNSVMCVSYVSWAYSDLRGDYTYCLPVDGISGGRIECGSPESYFIRANGCSRKFNMLDVSSGSGCDAVAEVEYNSDYDETVDVAGVSSALETTSGDPCSVRNSKSKIFAEGYDFCLVRTDDFQGPLACGSDAFLSAWLDSVLTWGGVDRSSICSAECYLYSIPDPGNCIVGWRNLVCDSTKAFVCPGNSDIWLDDTCRTSSLFVQVRDQFNSPMSGIEVCAYFDNASCDVAACGPVVLGDSDANGEVILPIRAGLNVSGDTSCCTVKTTVECFGITLYSETLQWLSPDMNGDSTVTVEDSLIFMSDWLTSAGRSDFNCDGIVDGLDLAILNAHYWHACAPSLVDVEEMREAAPTVWALGQNYPNPFNPYTSIRFSLMRPGRVVLQIFDIAGRPVRTLVDGWKDSGEYSEVWDGKGESGRELSSGVYFYRLATSDYVTTKKMILLK